MEIDHKTINTPIRKRMISDWKIISLLRCKNIHLSTPSVAPLSSSCLERILSKNPIF